MKLNESDSYAYEPRFTYAERRWKYLRRVLIFVGVLAAATALGLLFWQGIEVILLVFAGLILGVLFRSLATQLTCYTKIPVKWAVGIVILTLAGVVALGVWLTLPSIEQQYLDLSRQLPHSLDNLRQQVSKYPQGDWLLKQMPQTPEQIMGKQTANIFGRITGFFSSLLGIVVNVLIVLVTAIYFAFSPLMYAEGIVKLFPGSRQQRVREVIAALYYTLQSWIVGRTVVGVINGALTTLGLWYLGIPFAIPLGILAGLFNAVPNIGPILAGIPAVLLALPQGLEMVGWVVLLYIIIQNFEGFVLSPVVQQRSISLPPVLVLAGQLLLGILFGFLGVLVAVPAVAVIYVLVQMLYVEDVLGNTIKVKAEEETKHQAQAAS